MPNILLDATSDLKNILSTIVANTTPPKGSSNVIRRLKGAGIVAGLLGLGVYAGKELIIDPAIRSHKMKQSFSDLVEKVPQLEGKDEQQIKDYFGVIKTFSPKAAGNPLVAGNLINKMIEFGGIDHKIVQDLANIEGGFAKPSFGQAVAGTAAQGFVSMPGYKPI